MENVPEMLSIGICAHNEEESIAKTLEHIFKQTLWKKTSPDRREIIICANGCTDNTAAIVKKISKEHPEIKLIEISEKSKALAWKRIVHSSSPAASKIFFVDADVVVHHHALERIAAAFKEKPWILLVGGFAVPFGVRETKDQRMRQINEAYRKRVLKNKPKHLSGALYGINRNHALEIAKKMPDNILIEDAYIQAVTPKEQYMKVFSAKVYFKPPLSIKDYENQMRRFEAGKMQLSALGLIGRRSFLAELRAKIATSRGLPLKTRISAGYRWAKTRVSARIRRGDFWPKNVSSKLHRSKQRGIKA
ncbi:MAG: glycosyltransferase [Candidatus Diapherotrites archaeon]|nr:glycosyltransferase [Candidatus Diapherotrites archaeon]